MHILIMNELNRKLVKVLSIDGVNNYPIGEHKPTCQARVSMIDGKVEVLSSLKLCHGLNNLTSQFYQTHQFISKMLVHHFLVTIYISVVSFK